MEPVWYLIAAPLSMGAFFGALGLLINLYREHRSASFSLKPNCLLTRHPVVFITGPRSLFYFCKYWNAYPEILAEHGYPVFTLHLPWRGEVRKKRFQEFITQSPTTTQKYHFICDRFTFEELKFVFDRFSNPASVIVLQSQTPKSSPLDFSSRVLLKTTYRLHTWTCSSLAGCSLKLPSHQDLGLHSPTALTWLLEKVQEKGEQDFLESRT